MLVKPLTQEMIDAGQEFWDMLYPSDPELSRLQKAKPQDEVVDKITYLDRWYSTRVFRAKWNVADFIRRWVVTTKAKGPEMVEELIEDLRPFFPYQARKTVFCAKFVGRFVDPKVPIIDIFAEDMGWWHLGLPVPADGEERYNGNGRYRSFHAYLTQIREEAGLTSHISTWDPYLWIAGSFRFANGNASGDLAPYFERYRRDPGSEPLLGKLLGEKNKNKKK